MPTNMLQLNNLKHHLLIAMPHLDGSWFGQTVTYICEHNEEGAMGIVLNKPLPIHFSDICDQLEIPRLSNNNPRVFAGGPVSPENGFILHKQQGHWGSTLNVTEQTHLTTSKDILNAIASDTGPQDFRLALGYAGWDSEQLTQELRDNAWLLLEADNDLLFHTEPEQLYQAALARLGISPEFLSSATGNA